MRISVTVENTVPSPRYQYVVHHPHITIEDELMPGETPAEAKARLSTIANAMWAKELIDQLTFADRRHQIGNEAWCQEYLSSIGTDHAILRPKISPETLPPGAQATLQALSQGLTRLLAGDLAQAIMAEIQKLAASQQGE